MEDLPTYYEYSSQVDLLVSRGELTLEQGILLCTCFKATLNEHPVHINFLMQVSGLNWKQVNASLNGLVLRGAIRRVEEKYYMI
jgi:predicted Rossmann fold nucleotide-binding protein DprA/Smf involved in DNA uptake